MTTGSQAATCFPRCVASCDVLPDDLFDTAVNSLMLLGRSLSSLSLITYSHNHDEKTCFPRQLIADLIRAQQALNELEEVGVLSDDQTSDYFSDFL